VIAPKLLTPENGFEDGVVVEIEWENYSPSIEYYVWGSAMDQPQKEYMISQYGVSVRPITGPMSIWNHAPEWAQWLLMWDGVALWKRSDEPHTAGIERPFWATRSGE
jgi:hypothetical protein